MTILFAGDFLPRRPLDGTSLPSDTQLVANLECAIADRPAAGAKAYSLVLHKEADENVARSGFAALSLANNHVGDAGTAAFDEMERRLRRIPHTQFYGTRALPFATLEQDGCRVAVIGCMEPSRSRPDRVFREEDVRCLIRDLAASYDRVFVTPHWGKEGEYASHPSPQQRRLARRWIEAGASGVFGHHAHTIHGRERIGGVPVYYSLGNLLFDHEEGRDYSLTEFGLLVTWTPGARLQDDCWTETFILQRNGVLDGIDHPMQQLLTDYLDAISRDLTESPWSHIRWARAVGPVHIPKSRASWRQRMGGTRAWRNRLLHAIWAMLPRTLLLGVGCRFPDEGSLARREELTRRLDDVLRSRETTRLEPDTTEASG